MPTLAPKLPYTHAFAGGYPRRGGQPLPTDADAIDYLERVAAADGGAAVEVGVAVAVDAFVRGCKTDGIWDAIKASCLLCGPRTLSGALVPLVGTAPTSYAFASGDYNRVSGLKGDGSTTYLDSGFANDSLNQNDAHCSVYATEHESSTGAYIGALDLSTGDCQITGFNASNLICRFMANNGELIPSNRTTPFLGASRSLPASYTFRDDGANNPISRISGTPTSMNWVVFDRSTNPTHSTRSDARLAFYSIGSAISDLALLDTRITAYVAAVASALA